MLEMNVTAESKKTRALDEISTGMRQRTRSSQVLAQVIGQAPADYFTVGWLTSTLQRRSFGFIMLFLGLLATIPVGPRCRAFCWPRWQCNWLVAGANRFFRSSSGRVASGPAICGGLVDALFSY